MFFTSLDIPFGFFEGKDNFPSLNAQETAVFYSVNQTQAVLDQIASG